jgi:uncharacterized protein YjbI with pentapeptide repeats
MCNHSYKNFSINEKNFNCQLEKSLNTLPIDGNGKCLFHSEDIQWKQEQGFTSYLKNYVCFCKENLNKIDLREVRFVSEKGKTLIDYIDLLADAVLQEAHFHHTILFKGASNKIDVNGALNFKDCIFYHDVIFSNCNFAYDFILENICFKNDFGVLNLQIENCVFEYYFECRDWVDFSSNLTISGCTFQENASFESIYVLEHNFEIMSNEFLKNFSFTDAQINALAIDFSHTIFHENAEFNHVTFNAVTLFNNLKVVSKLLFTGTSERKIFYSQTHFNIVEQDIQGQIIFQLTNLMLIDARDLEIIKELEKVGDGQTKKVVVGAGCIKYRLMSPDLTYYIKQGHHYLISEIGNSFATYFTAHNGFNLGIEVRNKTKDTITLFYFSDEDIPVEEFLQLLGITSQRIFGIISGDSTSVMVQEDALVNLKIDLVSAFTKVSYQIYKNNWTSNDSKSFFGPLLPTPTIQLDENAAHAFLENKSVQEIIKQANGLNFIVLQPNNGIFVAGDVTAATIEKTKQ